MNEPVEEGNLDCYERKTADFFDAYTPEYSAWHCDVLLDFVKANALPSDAFLDVGCGNGGVLEYFREHTAIRKFMGIDISTKYLLEARARGFAVSHASILASNLPFLIGDNYSYILSSNLLHHLIGPTRNSSKANVRRAIINAQRLLRPRGRLLIHELVFSPSVAMDIVFWAKRIVTLFTSARLSSFSSWHNLGAPVVSYLGAGELKRIIEGIPAARIVMWHEKPIPLTWLMRLGFVGSVGTVACVVEKTSNNKIE